MAEPEPRASEAQTRASRTTARDSAAHGGAERPTEERVFEAGADVARRATDAGAQTARDMSRTGVETGRRLAETGVRAMDRGADLWRQSMFPLTTFSYEMNRLFNEFWRTALPGVAAPSMPSLSGPGAGRMQGLMGMPCADLHETPDSYHISVELAGMRPQEVEVMIDGDTLVVRGDKRDVHRQEQAGSAGFRVNERRFGRFERRFQLPRDADREGVEADFQDGLLEIRVARRPELQHGRRRIQVRHDGEARPEGRAGVRGEGAQPRA
jgi:HSP20 family protein